MPRRREMNAMRLTHLEVKLEALMLKKVAWTWLAMHLPVKTS